MEYKRKFREMDVTTKMKISQALRGRSKSSTHKDNISAGLKSYWQSVPNKPKDENNQ
jgi:hypothetical protein